MAVSFCRPAPQAFPTARCAGGPTATSFCRPAPPQAFPAARCTGGPTAVSFCRPATPQAFPTARCAVGLIGTAAPIRPTAVRHPAALESYRCPALRCSDVLARVRSLLTARPSAVPSPSLSVRPPCGFPPFRHTLYPARSSPPPQLPAPPAGKRHPTAPPGLPAFRARNGRALRPSDRRAAIPAPHGTVCPSHLTYFVFRATIVLIWEGFCL